jgi:hypothetical protein
MGQAMNGCAWLAFAAAVMLSAPLSAQDKDPPSAAPPADPPAAGAPAKPAATSRPVPGDQTIRPMIENGLLWLGHHQGADGGWGAQDVVTHCDAGKPCDALHEQRQGMYDIGLTGLAVLALLGTQTAPATPVVVHGAAGDASFDTWVSAQRAVDWLVAQQGADKTFAGSTSMYNDCIAALALCEASRVGKNGAWKKAAQRAIDNVAAGQGKKPLSTSLWGWRYVPGSVVGDTSVTGWAVRSLVAAKQAGLHVPRDSLAGAAAFNEWITGEKGGLVGYVDPLGAGAKVTGEGDDFDYHVGTMTALGIQVRLLTDDRPDKATVNWLNVAVSEVLLKDLPAAGKPLGVDYYYWHQGTEAWTLLGDSGFGQLAQTGKAWRSALVEALAALQSAPGATCSSGGWLKPDRWCHAGGPVYATAINVLTLEALTSK